MSREKNEALAELEAPAQELSTTETEAVQGGTWSHVKVASGADVTSEPDSTAGGVRYRGSAIVDRTN